MPMMICVAAAELLLAGCLIFMLYQFQCYVYFLISVVSATVCETFKNRELLAVAVVAAHYIFY